MENPDEARAIRLYGIATAFHFLSQTQATRRTPEATSLVLRRRMTGGVKVDDIKVEAFHNWE
jgi:hypothetical protein